MVYFGEKKSIYPTYETQIALLLVKEVIILNKYLEFIDVFSKKLALELFKYFTIYEYLIELKLGKQLSYSSIYSLRRRKLEILKTNIKTNLANSFICLSMSSIRVPIFFVQKHDSSFCLYVNYSDLNNLTIKNRYFLL